MKRMELMQRYLEQKHRTTLVHEQYLNTQREYAPDTALYMLEVTLGTVSQMAARLEKKGCVTRTPDPKNRRRTLVSLTEEGQRLYREHLDYDQANLARLAAYFSDFSDAELQRLIDAEIVFQQALRRHVPE